MGRVAKLLCIFAALAVGSSVASRAQAQKAAPPPLEKEPERFAYLVGNADYQFYSPKLPDLPDACTEAISIRDKLLSLHWKPDHIFPLVGPVKPGETAADAVREAVCNQKNDDLGNGLKRFVKMLGANENNPYALIYFAGHGAESNDEIYAFGVDSDVDLDLELKRVVEYPEYEPFSQANDPASAGVGAVDITEIIKPINGPRGKAVLVIFDACRNNPIVDNGSSSPASAAANLSPDQRRRLSIGPVNYRPDKYDQSFQNIMMMFAGRPSQTVPSGTAADPNWFAANLQKFIDQPANQGAGTANFVTDFEGFAKTGQHSLDPELRQIPQHIGSIQSTPKFCLTGCAQRLSIWRNEDTEVIQSAAPKSPVHQASNSRPMSLRLASFYGWPNRLAATRATFSGGLAIEALAPSSGVIVLPRKRRFVNLDVFYCRGDAGDSNRKDAARQFAESAKLMTETNADVVVSLDQIRLRSLNTNDNIALGHPKQANLLVLPRSESTWKDWRGSMGAGFEKVYSDGVTPGFIRAYFCKGATNKLSPAVYPQVAHASQKARAASIIASISAGLPGLKFQNIEPVDDTHKGSEHVPQQNEVRYYTGAQKDQALAVASALSSETTKKFVVKRGPTLGKDQKENPTIEIWFGLEELASWS